MGVLHPGKYFWTLLRYGSLSTFLAFLFLCWQNDYCEFRISVFSSLLLTLNNHYFNNHDTCLLVSKNMEEDSVACGLRCFICGGPETKKKFKSSQVTQKGYAQIVSYSESVEDAALIRRLHDDWKN